jgi:2-polyprenyl-6-hydroxyphenyl methylase/3-demethylubiquinone-9 3-methyltransferase
MTQGVKQPQRRQEPERTMAIKDQSELAGGAYQWWPPTKDHVVLFKANPLRLGYFEQYIGSWSGIRVLDVGCGGGYACEYLAKRQAVVSGTDILEESLHEAHNHAIQGNLHIDYRLCSPERLPYDDEAMDAVICFDVLEHIPDKPTTLSEIHRVLKPGGWLFFDTLNKTFLAKLSVIWFGEVILRVITQGTHDWRYFISPKELQRLLENAGFTMTQFAGIRGDWRRRNEGGLPVLISPEGNTSIIYFGATAKPKNR